VCSQAWTAFRTPLKSRAATLYEAAAQGSLRSKCNEWVMGNSKKEGAKA
jgi:hypothetical protein